MKNTMRLLIALVILVLVPQGLLAQASLTQTILSASITASATTMTVASATGFTASTNSVARWAYLDKELVKINTVTSAVIGISRGVEGTVATAHAVNAVVFTYDTANRGEPWQKRDYSGSCTRTLQTVQPIFNILTGNMYDCDATNGIWESVNLTQSLASSPYRAVENVAYTAGLYDSMIHYRSMSAGRTLTLPAVSGIYGKIIIVKRDGPTGTLTITGSASQGVGTATVSTNQTLTTDGSILRLMSAGGHWVTW